jgi:hypothetical protein
MPVHLSSRTIRGHWLVVNEVRKLLVVSICLSLGLFGICCSVSLSDTMLEHESLTLLVDLAALSVRALRVASVSGVHLAGRVRLSSIHLLLWRSVLLRSRWSGRSVADRW